MIKITNFRFNKLEGENYWANFARFGECVFYDTQLYDEVYQVPLRLNDGRCYQIGFDQSTSCTGMFIKDYENTEAWMIEVSKRRGDDASKYIFGLETFLHRVFEDALVSHLIYERPISSQSYQSSRVLFQLEGMIQQLSLRYPEFKNSRLDNIENSSWRRVAITADQKNNPSRKQASMNSIQSIFPWTQVYGNTLGNDYDVYEAMGVFFGWFINSYDALGRPYVRGDRFHGNVGGFILPDVSAKEVAEQLVAAGIKATWAMANPRKSIYENLVCGIEKYKVICVELTDLPSMLAMTVECNFKWASPQNMVVVLVAANYADEALFEITGKEYHFVV